MRLPNDFTLEALAILKRCKRVFGIPPISAPEFGLPEMEDLFQLYGPDKSRQQTYRQWQELVLDAAAEDGPVALATYGNAMVGALVTHRILETAPTRGLSAHTANSASCLDGLWSDLNIEPFYGFEIWEATIFVNLGIEPNTRATLMLPQAPVLGVRTGPDLERSTMTTSSTMTTLRDQLLRFYPPDHEIHFATTGSGVGPAASRPTIETLRLADLDHPGTQPMGTLVVPRLATPGLDFRRPESQVPGPKRS